MNHFLLMKKLNQLEGIVQDCLKYYRGDTKVGFHTIVSYLGKWTYFHSFIVKTLFIMIIVQVNVTISWHTGNRIS